MMYLENALKENSIEKLMLIPKSDIHSHAGRGGRIKYIAEWANTPIKASNKPFKNLGEMQDWFELNIKNYCKGKEGYLKRLEAAFAQAKKDSIVVLAMSFGIGEIDFLDNIDYFINAVNDLHKTFAPETKFFPELAIGRECNIDETYDRMDEILSTGWFKSIDICNDEFAQPIKKFQKIYRKAQSYGLKLKAHVGEFGTAEDVKEAVELLELSEVHHGIAAAKSKDVMKWLSNNKIQLNICPTSNIMLRRANSYSEHPIRELFDYGVSVTINTDDLLIFDSSVSEEYLKLYSNKVFSIDELEIIRQNGVNSYN